MNTALSLWQTVCLSGVVLAALFVPFLFKKAEEELEILNWKFSSLSAASPR